MLTHFTRPVFTCSLMFYAFAGVIGRLPMQCTDLLCLFLYPPDPVAASVAFQESVTEKPQVNKVIRQKKT